MSAAKFRIVRSCKMCLKFYIPGVTACNTIQNNTYYIVVISAATLKNVRSCTMWLKFYTLGIL